MDWDRARSRFDDHRGGESYRPGSSRGYSRRSRSPPRIRSPPPSRLVADTWVPSAGRTYGRTRSRSPPFRRRVSRSPQPYNRDAGPGMYPKAYSSRRFSPRRDIRPRSPASSSRQPRSPFGDDRPRDRNQNMPILRHPRDSPSSGRDTSYYRKERRLPEGRSARPVSPPRHGSISEDDQRKVNAPRSRSPFYAGRRDTTVERFSGQRRRSQSPNEYATKRPSASASISNSRRASPIRDKASPVQRSDRSRSPRFSRERGMPLDLSDRASYTRSKLGTAERKSKSPIAEHTTTRRPSNPYDTGLSWPTEMQGRNNNNQTSYASDVPIQPKAFSCGNNRFSPPGPPHGPKTAPSRPRASNLSLLSAPTRPRGSASFKENGWAGGSVRRGPAPVTSHSTPTGPRSNQLPTPGAETQRPRPYRQGSLSGMSSPHTQRYLKHLVGLNAIIPGGKLFPSELDAVTDKRLFQLDMDKDRLFGQNADSQKIKRIGLRDWDRLDRESSICALKCELAEGHLQCVADTEGSPVGAMF
ncbi:hypothetical protein BJX61DRAFT_507555 [Aspergillus egyptiacus]|nr:hypothetical protein BJX61DRAFT_507555 [Aspergillus egyptiacus]